MSDELSVGSMTGLRRHDCRGRGRQDVVGQLLQHNLDHVVLVHIFAHLDGLALMAASQVSCLWRRAAMSSIERRERLARRSSTPRSSLLWTTDPSEMASASVVAICSDKERNVYVLSVVKGRPQVTIGSLFNAMSTAWTQRLSEFSSQSVSLSSCLSTASLSTSTIASNVAMVVALGSEVRIYVCNFPFKWLQVVHTCQPHGATNVIHDVVIDVDAATSILTLATASDDMSVRVITFDLKLRKQLNGRQLLGHVNRVRVLDLDGGRVASGSDDRSVKIWGPDSTRSMHTLVGLSMPVEHVAICRDVVVAAARTSLIVFSVQGEESSLCCRLRTPCNILALHFCSAMHTCFAIDEQHDLHVIDKQIMRSTTLKLAHSFTITPNLTLDTLPGQMAVVVAAVVVANVNNRPTINGHGDNALHTQIILSTFDLI